MARARAIPLDPDEPFADAAARAVSIRAAELFGHSAGVLDTADIEHLHDMRVASRRLRAVLEIFAPCFPRRAHKAVMRDVKKLAAALGERRDPDVHIAALERMEREVPEDQRPGLCALLAIQRERQQAANARLEAALEEMERSALRERLGALVEAAR